MSDEFSFKKQAKQEALCLLGPLQSDLASKEKCFGVPNPNLRHSFEIIYSTSGNSVLTCQVFMLHRVSSYYWPSKMYLGHSPGANSILRAGPKARSRSEWEAMLTFS